MTKVDHLDTMWALQKVFPLGIQCVDNLLVILGSCASCVVPKFVKNIDNHLGAIVLELLLTSSNLLEISKDLIADHNTIYGFHLLLLLQGVCLYRNKVFQTRY